MDITISPQGNSITKELKFKLGNYTIFAGENNSGKSNILVALQENENILAEYKKDEIIYIPAEDVSPDKSDVFKTSATKSPFFQILFKILKPLLEMNVVSLRGLIDSFDQGGTKLELVNYVNDSLNALNIKNKRLKLKIDEDKFKEELIIKNIISSVIVDSHGDEDVEVSLENIGSGTKRIIISTLLQFYGGIKSKDKLLILFEEPEIYLHPKLKRSLYEALFKIAKDNIRVVITTHDPYFIELGSDQIIHNVSRDNDGATAVNPPINGKLPLSTHAETNYVIFGVPSTDYLLQLYQVADENGVLDKNYIIDSLKIFDI
ncbi:MAG: AAA family ATPase, partial [Patescibacteria group bacterium]